MRFLREVVEAVTGVLGAGRVGVRLSPFSNANNVGIDSDTLATFGAAIDVLNAAGVALLHMVEGQTGGPRDWPEGALEALRDRFNGSTSPTHGYTRETGHRGGRVGKGGPGGLWQAYISNPDLAERLALMRVETRCRRRALWRRACGLHRLSDPGQDCRLILYGRPGPGNGFGAFYPCTRSSRGSF